MWRHDAHRSAGSSLTVATASISSWLMFGLGRVKDGSPLANVAHILRQ